MSWYPKDEGDQFAPDCCTFTPRNNHSSRSKSTEGDDHHGTSSLSGLLYKIPNWDWIYGIAFTTSVGQPGAFSKRLGIKLRTGVFEFPITPTLFYGPSPASQYRPQNYHEIRLNCQFSLGLELSCAESNEHHSWSKKWFRYFRITATWTTSAAKAKGVKDLVSLIDLLLVSMDLLGLKQRVCDWNRYLS